MKPDQTPHSVASDLVLHCLPTERMLGLYRLNSTKLFISDHWQVYLCISYGHQVDFFKFDLILEIPVNNFQLCWDRSSLVEPILSKDRCVLLKNTTQ